MVGEDFDGGWKGMKWKIEERGGGGDGWWRNDPEVGMVRMNEKMCFMWC